MKIQFDYRPDKSDEWNEQNILKQFRALMNTKRVIDLAKSPGYAADDEDETPFNPRRNGRKKKRKLYNSTGRSSKKATFLNDDADFTYGSKAYDQDIEEESQRNGEKEGQESYLSRERILSSFELKMLSPFYCSESPIKTEIDPFNQYYRQSQSSNKQRGFPTAGNEMLNQHHGFTQDDRQTFQSTLIDASAKIKKEFVETDVTACKMQGQHASKSYIQNICEHAKRQRPDAYRNWVEAVRQPASITPARLYIHMMNMTGKPSTFANFRENEQFFNDLHTTHIRQVTDKNNSTHGLGK